MIKAEVLLRAAQVEATPEQAMEDKRTSNAFYLSMLIEDKADLIKRLHELNLEIRRLEDSLRSGT